MNIHNQNNKQKTRLSLKEYITETPDKSVTLTVEQFVSMVKDPTKRDELKQLVAKMDPAALAALKSKISPAIASSAPKSPAIAKKPPINARVTLPGAGTFTYTSSGWQNEDTKKPAMGSYAMLATKKYFANIAKSKITEAQKKLKKRMTSKIK